MAEIKEFLIFLNFSNIYYNDSEFYLGIPQKRKSTIQQLRSLLQKCAN